MRDLARMLTYLDLDSFHSLPLGVCHLDVSCFAGDVFDSTHERVGHDSHTQKTPHHPEEINNSPSPGLPCVFIDDREHQAFVGTYIVV